MRLIFWPADPTGMMEVEPAVVEPALSLPERPEPGGQGVLAESNLLEIDRWIALQERQKRLFSLNSFVDNPYGHVPLSLLPPGAKQALLHGRAKPR
jgi:hypothetical protein